jgi:hypothetical protein
MSTPNLQSSKTVTVANGASLSGSSGLLEGAQRLLGIITDSAWDTNAVTFQGSVDGTNFFNLYKEGTEYSLAGVVASTYQALDPVVFLGVRAVKVRSGTAAAAVNQTGDAVITLVTTAF